MHVHLHTIAGRAITGPARDRRSDPPRRPRDRPPGRSAEATRAARTAALPAQGRAHVRALRQPRPPDQATAPRGRGWLYQRVFCVERMRRARHEQREAGAVLLRLSPKRASQLQRSRASDGARETPTRQRRSRCVRRESRTGTCRRPSASALRHAPNAVSDAKRRRAPAAYARYPSDGPYASNALMRPRASAPDVFSRPSAAVRSTWARPSASGARRAANARRRREAPL
jgi:hypothetical protein